MKRLLPVVLILLTYQAFAQRQNQIVETWKMWSTLHEFCHPNGTVYTTDFVRFNGDTVIEGVNYKIVEMSEDENHENWSFYGYFIREENQKVYLKRPFEPEGLIYDFSLQGTGDTVTINNPTTSSALLLTLAEKDSVETTGGWRERWRLTAEGYENPEYWILGIGSESGVLYSGMAVFGGLCGSAELLCQHQYDTLVYQNSQYGSCYVVTTAVEEKSTAPRFKAWYGKNDKKIHLEFESRAKRKITVTGIDGKILLSTTFSGTRTAFAVVQKTESPVFVSVFENGKKSVKKIMIF